MSERNLKLLKGNETGFGLLIEYDGYINPNDEKNKEVLEKIKNDRTPENYGKTEFPLELYAVFLALLLENYYIGIEKIRKAFGIQMYILEPYLNVFWCQKFVPLIAGFLPEYYRIAESFDYYHPSES